MEREITLAIELYDSITMQRITRDVTFYASWNENNSGDSNFYYSKDHQFAARIGRGIKLHSTDAAVIFFKDAEQARKQGWLQFGRKPLFTDANGVMYFFRKDCTIRNSQAVIQTWADLYIDSPVATQQQYYGSIKAGA
jgi:hypothetical protein